MTRVLALLLAAACGPAPRTDTPTAELPEPDPALREVARDAVLGAERRGLAFERADEPHFAVEARAHVAPVAIPARSCRVFVLVGATGVVQASAALYLPDGRRLGRDLGQSGPPEVGACSGETPLALYWHTSVRGAGLVQGLEFAAERSTATTMGLVNPEDSVGELALALRRRGFVPRGEERTLQLRPEREERFPVVLRADRCLTLVVRGVDAEIELFEDSEPVVRDGAGGEQAVQICAEGAERRLIARLRSREGGEAEVRVYDVDRGSLGGDSALWLGERTPAVTESVEPPESRLYELGPAEVVEVALPEGEGCTTVWVRAGEGSQGVWLGDPSETKRSIERCVEGPRARVGSVGGGRAWVGVGSPSPAPTPRPPAQRGARR